MWIWRLGDAVLVGVPAEAHSGLQIELRRRFPHRAVAVMNIVNGHYSYLPPAADYAVRAPTRSKSRCFRPAAWKSSSRRVPN